MVDSSGTLTGAFISGSTNGRGIKVDSTTTSGATALHTAVSGTASIDYVTLSVCNTHTSSVVLTIEFGGTTDPDDHIEVSVGSQRGLQVVCDRMPINNGLAITAYASVADVIVVFGEVITEKT